MSKTKTSYKVVAVFAHPCKAYYGTGSTIVVAVNTTTDKPELIGRTHMERIGLLPDGAGAKVTGRQLASMFDVPLLSDREACVKFLSDNKIDIDHKRILAKSDKRSAAFGRKPAAF